MAWYSLHYQCLRLMFGFCGVEWFVRDRHTWGRRGCSGGAEEQEEPGDCWGWPGSGGSRGEEPGEEAPAQGGRCFLFNRVWRWVLSKLILKQLHIAPWYLQVKNRSRSGEWKLTWVINTVRRTAARVACSLPGSWEKWECQRRGQWPGVNESTEHYLESRLKTSTFIHLHLIAVQAGKRVQGGILPTN